MFEQNLKILWIFMMFSFSLIYFFYMRHEEKPTPFFSVSIIRIIMRSVSFIILISLPLMLFALQPEYSGFDFIYTFFWLYITTLIIYIITLNIDFFRYGVPMLLKSGGIDLKDDKTKKAYERLVNGRR